MKYGRYFRIEIYSFLGNSTTKIYFVDKSAPATQAFIDVVITPARNALNTTSDISFPRDGAIALNPATWIPIELGFAKPHKAIKVVYIISF